MYRPADRFNSDPDDAETSRFYNAAVKFVRLADDLPFVPSGPYEPRAWQLFWRGALLAVLAFLAYLPTLLGDWLWLDDRLILNDVSLRTLRGLAAIWADPLATAPPGVRTLWWLESHAFGFRPGAFRGVGVAMHAAGALAVWAAMRRLRVSGAWLIAAVFAVHPAALPNVAWPARQGEILGLCATAVAFWAFLVARRVQPDPDEREWTDPAFVVDLDEESPPRWPWAVFGVAVLIALSTGTAVGAVAAAGAMLIEWRQHGTRSRGVWATLVAWAAVSLVVRLLMPITTAAAFAAADPGGPRWAEAAVALPWTVWHVVVPVETPFAYDRWQWASLGWTLPLALATVAVVALAFVRRVPWTITLAAAAVLAVLHSLAIVRTPAPAVMSGDLTPVASTFAVLAAVVGLLMRRLRRHLDEQADRAARWAIGVVMLAGLAWLTIDRGPAYAGVDAAWRMSLAHNPDSRIARTELAASYMEAGFIEEAGTQLDRVPDDARDVAWLLSRGRVYEAQKRPEDAAATFQLAFDRKPDDATTVVPLAEAYVNVGKPERAAELYDGLLKRVPGDPGLLTNAGLAQMRIGKPAEAAVFYEKALALDPRYVPAHINRANALFETGDFAGSSKHLQDVIKLDPRNFPAFMNAGVLLYRLRDNEKAERMFRAAISIDGRSAEAFCNLGIVQAAQEKRNEALWSFAQALRIDPDHKAREYLDALRRTPPSTSQPARRP